MKLIKYLFLSFAVLQFVACQEDEIVIIQDNTQNLSANSPLTNLISRISQNSTSKDNILDNSSCFTVHLPVTINVNAKQIIVTNQDDYKTVQSTLDAFSNDDDVIHFIYPITIQFKNFNTKQIINSDQLNEVIDACEDNDDFDEIDCLNINYPIKISIYNTISQIANTVTIQNDSDLYNTLDKLENNFFIAINYPISATNFNGQNIVVLNNSDFEAIIEANIKECKSGSGGSGNSSFVSTLTNGTWHVSYYFENKDETLSFNTYNFIFNSDESISVLKSADNSSGDWSDFVSNGQEGLELDFDDDKLNKLESDWKIIEYTSSNIRLKNENKYLSFTKK